ncbi:MAG: hypothetical protein IKP46_07250 [Bacteroidales bacterium]|nr:hypothetical protein [Bacteroidales bacterium]
MDECRRVREQGGSLLGDEIESILDSQVKTVDEFFLQKKSLGLSRQSLNEDLPILLNMTHKYHTPEVAAHIIDLTDGPLDLLYMNDTDGILTSRVFLCETQEDIWDILLEGIGNPREFVYTYCGMSRGWPNYPYGTLLPKEERGLTYSISRLWCFIKYMIAHNVKPDNILFDLL